VPKPPPRRVQILALREAGQSVESIARALGCTRRRVFQVLAEARRTAHAGPARATHQLTAARPRALGPAR
jgi:transcriptional regulator